MMTKFIAYMLVFCLVFPHQLVIFASTGDEVPMSQEQYEQDQQEMKSALGNMFSDINSTGFEVSDDTVVTEPEETEVDNSGDNDTHEEEADVPVQDNDTEATQSHLSGLYYCLIKQMNKNLLFNIEDKQFGMESMGDQSKYKIWDFTIDVKGGAKVFPAEHCKSKITKLNDSDYTTFIRNISTFFNETGLEAVRDYKELVSSLDRETALENSAVLDRFELKPGGLSIKYEPTGGAPVVSESIMANLLALMTRERQFEVKGESGENLSGDPDKLLSAIESLDNTKKKAAMSSMIALFIRSEYAFITKNQFESQSVDLQTLRETTRSELARREAEDQEKSAKNKEFWGNVGKGLLTVGLAVGGGLLAWHLIDSLNDDDDDDDDDEFDGPMYPYYNQMPYMPPQSYPMQTYQPYPPQNYTPVQPTLPTQNTSDLGTLLVDLKAKLEAIIKLQRNLITNYVQRTNTNMTDSDKDTFRRTVAQIDGLVTEANPLIQMMENSAIPAGGDLNTINTARAECYTLITEVKNNDRIIKEFNSQMNIVGSGVAGPAAAGTSPAAATSTPTTAASATPWTDPTVIEIINGYLTTNKLNQWGLPDTPGVVQHTPPSAVGKNRYEWLMQNPKIYNYVQSELAKKQ
jgi:hypothetical protein